MSSAKVNTSRIRSLAGRSDSLGLQPDNQAEPTQEFSMTSPIGPKHFVSTPDNLCAKRDLDLDGDSYVSSIEIAFYVLDNLAELPEGWDQSVRNDYASAYVSYLLLDAYEPNGDEKIYLTQAEQEKICAEVGHVLMRSGITLVCEPMDQSVSEVDRGEALDKLMAKAFASDPLTYEVLEEQMGRGFPSRTLYTLASNDLWKQNPTLAVTYYDALAQMYRLNHTGSRPFYLNSEQTTMYHREAEYERDDFCAERRRHLLEGMEAVAKHLEHQDSPLDSGAMKQEVAKMWALQGEHLLDVAIDIPRLQQERIESDFYVKLYERNSSNSRDMYWIDADEFLSDVYYEDEDVSQKFEEAKSALERAANLEDDGDTRAALKQRISEIDGLKAQTIQQLPNATGIDVYDASGMIQRTQ